MPWSGGAFTRTNGVHTGSTLWVQDRDAGTKILATRHDTHDQDLADGINATLEKSGSNAATGNLDIGSNRITLVADGTAKTDVATVSQIQSNAAAFQATDTGTANAYVIALSPAITAYAAGQAITFKAGAASTTASTLNVNTLGTKALKKKNDQDIASGDIEASQIVTAVYDGTSFQVTSQLGSEASAGGSNTQIQYNSSGSLAGSAHLTFDGTSATVANPFILPDGAVGTPALTNTGDLNTGVYFPAADQLGVVVGGSEKVRFGSNPFTGRNLLINGDMQIDQRAAAAAWSTAAEPFPVDRWRGRSNGSPTFVADEQQSTTVSPSGFGNSIHVDVTTADATMASGDTIRITQRIEAQDLQRLDYGAAGASPLALSFWVFSDKTGTYNAGLFQPDATRSYVSEYTIDASETWEQKVIVVPGDASGTINNDTGNGLEVVFGLAGGATFQTTADAWAAGTFYHTSGAVNFFDNVANDIYITGVQLEVGEVATAFEHRGVGEELARCDRYYQRYTDIGAHKEIAALGFCDTTTTTYGSFFLRTPMRADPTGAASGATDFRVQTGTGPTLIDTTGVTLAVPQEGVGQIYFTVASGLTVGDPARLLSDDSGGRYLEFTAEL
jgi:hypothetical protein